MLITVIDRTISARRNF